MARRSKQSSEPDTMTSNDTPAQTPTRKRGPVIVDYRGMVGRATVDKGALSNQRAVPHRLSPLMAFWPENGVEDLQLQPGLNLVDPKIWNFYTKEAKGADGSLGHPQVMEKVKARYIREITELPDDSGAIHSMIERSMDADGLRWIAEQESAGDAREDILDAVTDRLAKIRPVKLGRSAFQRHVPAVKDSNAPQPAMAMG